MAADDMRATSERSSTELVETTQIDRYNGRTYFPTGDQCSIDLSASLSSAACAALSQCTICTSPIVPASPLCDLKAILCFTLTHLEYHEM